MSDSEQELNIKIFEKTYAFLLEILPDGVTREFLEEQYFIGDQNIFKKRDASLKDVFDRLIFSAQNYNIYPNVIKYIKRKDEIREILFDFDIEKIARMDDEEILQMFYNAYGRKIESSHNTWRRWCTSITTAAQYLQRFSSVADFVEMVRLCSKTVDDRIRIAKQIGNEIHGLGFATVCDALKELGFVDYAFPSKYVIEVFEEVGLLKTVRQTELKKQEAYFAAVTKMTEYCKSKHPELTVYKVDKVFSLICTGYFYHHMDASPKEGYKKELITILNN